MTEEYSLQYLDTLETLSWIERAGKVRVAYPNGDTYEGSVNSKGYKHGNGTYTWKCDLEANPNLNALVDAGADPEKMTMKYTGEYLMGNKHGIGSMEYPDGSKYKGSWQHNQRQGVGTYTYPSGDKYSGSWVAGKRHGHGAYVSKVGRSQYVGVWQNGQLSQGQWVLENGTIYSGSFNDGICPSGEGRFDFPGGGQELGELSPSVVEDDDAATSFTWSGKGAKTAALKSADVSRALSSVPPLTATREIVEKLKITSADASGCVTITNEGDTQANCQGLRLEHRDSAQSKSENSDENVENDTDKNDENQSDKNLNVLKVFVFKNDCKLEAGQSCYILSGDSAAPNSANVGGVSVKAPDNEEGEEAEGSLKPLFLVWGKDDIFSGALSRQVLALTSPSFGDLSVLEEASGKDEVPVEEPGQEVSPDEPDQPGEPDQPDEE